MFLYSRWMELPLDTRAKIAMRFDIPRVGATHVDSNRIISDGYNIQDIEAKLNIDAIQKFTGVESTDMLTLWDLMLTRIENPTPDVVVIPPAPEPMGFPMRNKGGRPKKIKPE